PHHARGEARPARRGDGCADRRRPDRDRAARRRCGASGVRVASRATLQGVRARARPRDGAGARRWPRAQPDALCAARPLGEGAGQSLAGRAGYAGSFFTGALATVAATPCTAPFMGAAVGYAVTQPWPTALLVFEALALGLALPFLLLTLIPAWRRFLPRPGRWMERLQQALAFPLYASVAWLLWVVSQQAGSSGVA